MKRVMYKRIGSVIPGAKDGVILEVTEFIGYTGKVNYNLWWVPAHGVTIKRHLCVELEEENEFGPVSP